MNILVIGSGGREHAIAWRCAAEGHTVFAAPGNPGIAQCAECVTPQSQSPEGFLEVARQVNADLTIVGPELPLTAGIVDLFEQHGRRIFGPSKAAARLEGSKSFSKEFMARHGIATARFQVFDDADSARRALARFEYPVVLKADGLAAGKGVVIAKSKAEALDAIGALFSGSLAGAAASRIVIEDFCPGEEVSFIAICDHNTALALPPTQDHKAIHDNDEGSNTGGMGAYCDDRILTPELKDHILDRIVLPTLQGCIDEGMPFRGFLFAGLMLTSAGVKVLEFNVRLGDPETQAILCRIESGFVETILAATEHRLPHAHLNIANLSSACVVLAAHGYPSAARAGDMISGIEAAESAGAKVFQAGTASMNGHLKTAGGRVLGVTAVGPDLESALDLAYAALTQVHFEGMQFRSDIGQKGLKRYT